jgi:hypothetical protein
MRSERSQLRCHCLGDVSEDELELRKILVDDSCLTLKRGFVKGAAVHKAVGFGLAAEAKANVEVGDLVGRRHFDAAADGLDLGDPIERVRSREGSVESQQVRAGVAH